MYLVRRINDIVEKYRIFDVLCIIIIMDDIMVRVIREDTIGQGLISTMWKGWFFFIMLIYFC